MSYTRKNQPAQQFTVPGKAVVQGQLPDVLPQDGAAPKTPAPKPATYTAPGTTQRRPLNWWIIGGGGLLMGFVMASAVLIVGLVVLFSSSDIAPGVKALGVDVGGLSQAEAAAEIEASVENGVILTDGNQQWRADTADLGLEIDATATAAAAYEAGRRQFLQAIVGGIDVSPVWAVDLGIMRTGLQALQPTLESPAKNAGVQLVNGQVVATAPQYGRQLDIEATLVGVQNNTDVMLRSGEVQLVMRQIAPTITDATPLLAQATQLLQSELVVTAFDPIANERTRWVVPAVTWASWLETTDNNTAGFSLRLSETMLRHYLDGQASNLPSGRYLNVDEAVNTIQAALANQTTSATVRVYYKPSTYAVRAGETLYSIAYNTGIPYSWIREANAGVGDVLSVGQQLTIPSPDELIPLPIVENKRIVVSIPQQRMWVYENDTVKWEWLVSTGIQDSPTAPGVFQVQSHHENAYAGNWNLWMPYFMGIYRPVPGLDFMNGFHGFPTRDGYQLLWTNSLGMRVTYGCILLSNENVQLLYDWAEPGVIVDIQG